MTQKVFIITAIYFLLGAFLLWRIAARHTEKQKVRESWIKYLAYLVIVAGMMAGILTHTLRYVSAGLSVLAIYEVLQLAFKQQQLHNKTFLWSFPLMLFMVYAFLWYAEHLPEVLQLYVYTLVLTFDGFSQLIGQLWGRHKLAPFISPGKTWEGLAGGLVFSGLSAFVLGSGISPGHTVLLWTGVAAFALAGDLYASYCKRLLKVKDYSNLVPGHGGILDRFDSLFGASVFLYFLSYFEPIWL